jgi:NAD(P)H-nitrite reductase large subunit
MSQKTGPKNAQRRPKIICFCYNVPEAQIIQAIREGCSSLMDIRRETYASTGCAGCSEEIKKLLRKYALKPGAGQGEGGGQGEGQGGAAGGGNQGKASNG